MTADDENGRKLRLDILERDAQEPILGLLRTHGWNAAIERRGSDADYLIITATRAGITHRVALLYSSSTARKVYERLAAFVDAILGNHGLDPKDVPDGLPIPVLTRDDFFTVVLAWNEEVAPAKIAPDAGAPPAVRLSKGRRIQAEMPLESIWTRLRQLGSVTLARRLVETRMAAAGIGPAREVAEPKADGRAYAVRNATDYLRHADPQSLSQRILILHSGTVSFAMAELLAAPNGAGTLDEVESTTKRGHGLYTVDGPVAAFDTLIFGAVATRTRAPAGSGFPADFDEASGMENKTWQPHTRRFGRRSVGQQNARGGTASTNSWRQSARAPVTNSSWMVSHCNLGAFGGPSN
ncbi:MAG: hypothetical protein IT379_30380 [Deltaproteobacteria bacterium]|nr:hypothetical protein [Deltaproteobacteria bacterium]